MSRRLLQTLDDDIDVLEDTPTMLETVASTSYVDYHPSSQVSSFVTTSDFKPVSTAVISLGNRVTYLEQQNRELKKEIKDLRAILDSVIVTSGGGSKIRQADKRT